MATRTEQLLRDLNKTDGVHESLIVGRDGFVIDHAGDMDAEAVGAIVSTVIGTVESMGRDADQGGLFELMAEFKEGVMIVAPVGTDAVLGIAAEAGSNLGRIRHEVKKSLRELERLL